MRRYILAASLLAGFLLVSPAAVSPAWAEKGAPAAPAAPVVAPPPLGQDALSQGMARIMGASIVYKDMVLESEDLMTLVIEGSSRAADEKNPPDKAWLAAWKARVAAKAASVRAHRDALPPFPRDAFKMFEGDPEVRRMLDGISKMPQTARFVADTMLNFAADITPLVEAAVGGDEDAKLKLVKASMRGVSAALKAENALLDLSINTGMSAHPQTALSRAVKSSNESLILVFDYIQDALEGGKAGDPAALMAAVRDKLDESRAEARKIGPMARLLGSRMDDPRMPEGLRVRIAQAMATYEESGKVELQIDDVLEKGIEAVLRDPGGPGGQILDEDLQPLVERRVALQNQRMAALAQ